MMQACWPLALFLLSACALTSASTGIAAGGDTGPYFKLLREYFGEKAFSMTKCLAQQEQNGWAFDGSSSGLIDIFTLGVESSGHHLTEDLLDSFASVAKSQSVPHMWRVPLQMHCPWPGQHPEIHDMVAAGKFIVILVRYPPASLLATLHRFAACNHGHGPPGQAWPPTTNLTFEEVVALPATKKHPLPTKEQACYKSHIDAFREVLVHQDAVSTVDDLMRYPKFDCNKLLVLPFEALTQHPQAFLAPIAQAFGLTSDAEKNTLSKQLESIKGQDHLLSSGASAFKLDQQCCMHLGMSVNLNWDMTARGYYAHTHGKRHEDCAADMYTSAKKYFDERRYMFPSYYPSSDLVEQSANANPIGGLKLLAP